MAAKTCNEFLSSESHFPDRNVREWYQAIWDAAIKSVEVQKPSHNSVSPEIAEMSKCVKCLALELPGPVWDDVNRIWNAVLAQLSGKWRKRCVKCR